ncbi:hypothetical protein K1719_016590 [Acacia pycnantha]|nr:hypothetical protein K1719_016590 [Acacia pycnantha]
MMLLIIQIALALCALGAKADTLVGVGVNYGRLGDNLPPPSDVFSATDIMVQDGSFGYSNLLDAMIDSFYWAMENAGFADVEVVVSRVVGLRW